ncbi:Innexin [Fasciola gigantica]|uniref:Innexin n=1 Tax=Fasciola gigantica TaxID=46835 RepID=A0A504YVE1_FASGI|nr:Innexin [Fasciola gigantica]
MVATEFLNLWHTLGVANISTAEDFADRLNLLTVILFMLATTIVSVKQYVLSSISCYIPVTPSGESFNEFLNSYCWVHGTIPLRPDELLPETDASWNEYDDLRRVSKYCVSTLFGLLLHDN